MWADFKASPRQHYYIKEIAQLSNGTFVIPMRWVRQVGDQGNTIDCADALEIIYDIAVSNVYTLKDCYTLLIYYRPPKYGSQPTS